MVQLNLEARLRRSLINGTPGNDSLRGTDGIDTINGLAGDDNIQGLGGNDSLDGGAGYDSIDGGLGNDSIVGGLGNDSIVGGAGNDSIDGGAGRDTLFGGVGNDSIVGGLGNDSIDGGAGNDSIVGGAGRDTLLGGVGNDTLQGGAGRDQLIGTTEAGVGTGEIDELTGGATSDTFVLGTATQVFYDDGRARTVGEDDYALITDFNITADNVNQRDVIQLKRPNQGDEYVLDYFIEGGITSAILSYDTPSSRAEVIAILQNISAPLDLGGSNFQYLPEVIT